MTWIKENWFRITILFVILLAAYSFYGNVKGTKSSSDQNIIFSYKREKEAINLPLNQSASCNFERDVSVVYGMDEASKNKEVKFSLNKNTEPLNISFINLDTEIPVMRGNGGQSDLIRIINNDEVVTVIEKD